MPDEVAEVELRRQKKGKEEDAGQPSVELGAVGVLVVGGELRDVRDLRAEVVAPDAVRRLQPLDHAVHRGVSLDRLKNLLRMLRTPKKIYSFLLWGGVKLFAEFQQKTIATRFDSATKFRLIP